MSVVCTLSSETGFRLFVKGSPEKLLTLCRAETVPSNFDQILESYTKEGYRVIALGTKILTNLSQEGLQSVDRD
jgi:cation-transporting ATPase 13A3/4/5